MKHSLITRNTKSDVVPILQHINTSNLGIEKNTC